MSKNLGELHAASVLDDDGTAVLVIAGTDGTATIEVPEDMTRPFEDTAQELALVYDDEAREETDHLIG